MLFGGWLKNLPYLNLIKNLCAQMKHKQRKEQATSAERSLEGYFIRILQKELQVYAKAHEGGH